MSINEILDAVLNQKVCPFTKKPYDCARCDAEKYRTDWLNKGTHKCHMGLCITAPLIEGENGWRRVLRYFNPRDKKEAREILTRLLKLGVEQIPMGDCDQEHFCFRRGCDGHKCESEAKA